MPHVSGAQYGWNRVHRREVGSETREETGARPGRAVLVIIGTFVFHLS